MTWQEEWIAAAPRQWTRGRIKNLIASSTNGTWGEEPSETEGAVKCIRAADFDRQQRRINIESAPLRRVEPADLARHRLNQNDLIIEKSGGGDKQPVGMVALYDSHETAVCSNFCARIIPAAGVSAKFLNYVFQAAYSQGLTSGAIKQTTGIQNLDTNVLYSTSWAYPDLEEQRRVADFLDIETNRMATLGGKLDQFTSRIAERERSVLAEMLNGNQNKVGGELPWGWSWRPLMHLTSPLRPIMYGIVLPGPDVDDGVPIVKGGDVAADRLHLGQLCRTAKTIEARHARSRLSEGDLVIAIRGSVGEVAVVPRELAGANLTQDAARISIGCSINASWLFLALQSPLVNSQIQERVTGATIKGINIRDLKRISIPTPELKKQDELAIMAKIRLQSHQELRSRVSRHRLILAERRQALITAAVTGQFDVSTASGRGVTE